MNNYLEKEGLGARWMGGGAGRGRNDFAESLGGVFTLGRDKEGLGLLTKTTFYSSESFF